ncbi:TonB-dependent receptor [Lonepinella koalarum]|uniref:TonB-dependent receptor n=1 Tax=Lonepinella koalarum TaxID=53417 RepID=UPI003F6E317A
MPITLKKQPVILIGVCSLTFHHTATAAESPVNNVTYLEEIVVTGEKFERSTQETGSSLAVTTDKDLKQQATKISSTHVLQNTPNVLDTGLGNDLPVIRGTDGSGPASGAVAFFAGSRPRMNLSIDGRSANYNELAFGTKSLWDMKQVEVYRGAQSYAQGRNAIAGAVVMTSNDPTHEFEGAAKASFANQNYRQYAIMLSGPLVKDELAFRLAAERQNRTSFQDLPSYPEVGDPRKYETNTVRAKLLWTPSAFPDFYARLTYNYIGSRSPQNEMNILPAGTPQASSTLRPVFVTKSNSGVLDTGLQLNDVWKWENKLVYSKYKIDRLAASPLAPNGYNGNPANVDGDEFQIEPVLKFKTADGKYAGLLGLYYFQSKQDEWVGMNNAMGGKNTFDDKITTKAVFGELTYEPVDWLEILLSARYEEERHQRHGGTAALAIHRDKTEKTFLPKVDIAYKFSPQQRVGVKVGRGYNPGGAGITFSCIYPPTYIGYGPCITYEYDPEYVWNYELYHRWLSEDKTLELNTNVFYNRYKDIQLPYGSSLIGNAEKAITYGAEFNVNWQATENWYLHAALGLLKTKIKRYDLSPSYAGNKLRRSPNYTLNLGTTYKWQQGWEIGVDAQFTDGYYSNNANDDFGKISSYSQTNAHLAYNFKQGRVMLFVNNVFNDRKITHVPFYNRLEAVSQQPRLYGISTEFRF